MFSRVGAKALKTDLRNTLELLKELGDPQKNLQCIHVAGTNGKGSVSHMMAAILQEHEFKTGLYTSPHLTDFRERIRINGTWIDEESVVAITEKLKPAIESFEPSFFEVTVAMTLDYFAQQQVDIAIMETGLGGLLDSTNVVDPEISIITNIGFDHMSILGETLEKIAEQKAGIIKPGRPVVIGETHPETEMVFRQKAAETGSEIIFADQEYAIGDVPGSPTELQIGLISKRSGEHIKISCDLPGNYQRLNVRTAWTAAEVLKEKGWNLDDQKTILAFSKVKGSTGLRGRWEVLGSNPYLVLDVAHNPHGMNLVVEQLKSMQREAEGRRIHMVIGMVKDKEIAEVIRLLSPEWKYYFTHVHSARQFPAAGLRDLGAHYGLKGGAFENVNEALKAALNAADGRDVVIVCGSVFLVGELDRESLC